ncbi:SpaA isopeptide-forming pilin-related protein [Haematomicrobium sanguinis]|uniref:DUF7927 domain-containing protein n=1 Tax=Haematomicrobium sanguinis TaxID=479106 RepID=UPI00146FA374|nr:SpaA isopeptide-forming pilin-related protein [Haematomicrobium sanguinis]
MTNTSELASKQGWSFTDNLPSGLAVANPPNIRTSCPNGVLTATPGQSNISVKGDLNQGQVSCTFSVDVTSATPAPSDPSPKVYQNCPDVNVVNMVGVNAPNCAQVEFFTVRKLTITKKANKTELRQGDPVTYTVTMTNTGTGDYTTDNPAMFRDDLAGISDDATLTASGPGAPSARYLNPDGTAIAPVLKAGALEWNGALKAGQSVEFTYTVTTNNNGDGVMNSRACASAPNQPATCAEVTLNLPRLTVQKSADKTVVNNDGDEVTYTVRVTNAGPGNFTASLPASVEDDLSKVLDDADLVTSSLAARYVDPAGTATNPTFDATAKKLNWSGALAAGQSVELTYRVKYANKADGTKELTNLACIPVNDTLKNNDSCATVTVGAPNVSDKKQLEGKKDGEFVNAGDVLTYTIEFKNTGKAPGQVNREDYLNGVLDDAEFVRDSSGSPQLVFDPSDSGLTVYYVQDENGQRIVIGGTIQPGATVTLTYKVTVNPVDKRGDSTLANFLINPGQKPPTTCELDSDDCTTNPVTGEVNWNKVDGEGAALAGSEWSLTDSAGTVVAVIDNGSNDADSNAGALRVKDLIWGDYTLVETKAPEGYLKSTAQYPVTVNGTSIDVAIGDIVNTRIVINLEKYGFATASQSKAALIDGSEFMLSLNQDGAIGEQVGTITATGTGTFQITDISPGSYWLQETKAPAGHNLLAQAIQLDVSQNSSGTLVLSSPEVSGVVELQQDPPTVKVFDQRAITLPIAGGRGTAIFTIAGLLIVALAVALTLRVRKRTT